ncbi:MAG: energy-coupling factor transporter transmembrane protein EcfT [Clostridiales bacterium]|nr:energy-coupling factor transporter transmembrane protein EcfT [Clostridiales bacterium]
MLKDITIGQFFPGDTVIHKLDPRIKLIATFLYIVAIFMAKSDTITHGIVSYGLSLLWLFIITTISKIPIKLMLKGLKPLLFIIVFTAVLNVFYTPGRVLFEFYFLHVTYEGIVLAFFMVIRIILLITGTSLLTYTTSPIMLTDGIETLLNPLKKIKVPVHELSMMMTIALRFIPTLIEETEKIMNAQKARGADFESGNLIERAKSLVPILIPLFVSAFRRADELAIAMECRLYQGGEGRTRLKELRLYKIDYTALFLCLIFFFFIIASGKML